MGYDDDDGDEFGDFTPEDAYDASDRAGVLVNNLRRRVAALDGGEVDYRADLTGIADRLRIYMRGGPHPADLEQRAQLLADDLATVRRVIVDGRS
jgi:hypothetical protein